MTGKFTNTKALLLLFHNCLYNLLIQITETAVILIINENILKRYLKFVTVVEENMLVLVMQSYNPSIWETKAEGQPEINSKTLPQK